MSENNENTNTPNVETAATSHPENTSGALNGNDAVNQAAEQWKDAASHNIPAIELGDAPVPADTANLRQGPSLHDGLLGLLPLVGVWQGEGQAHDTYEGEEAQEGPRVGIRGK